MPYLSLLWSPIPPEGIFQCLVLIGLMLAASLGGRLESRSLSRVFRCAAYGIGLNSIFAVIQCLGFHPVIQLSFYPSGLFLNANVLAETSALILAGTLATATGLRYGVFALMIMPSVLLSHHRGSMIALAIAGMIWLLSTLTRYWRWRLWPGLLVVGSLLALLMLLRDGDIGWGAADGMPASLAERLDIWHATLSGLTWFGHGGGSFRSLFPLYAAPYLDTIATRPLHAHNDILELIFEYGIFACVPIAFTLLCLASRSPYRYVVIVFLVEGLSGFPLFMPATGFLFALSLGDCYRGRDWAFLGLLWRRICVFARLRDPRPGLDSLGSETIPVRAPIPAGLG